MGGTEIKRNRFKYWLSAPPQSFSSDKSSKAIAVLVCSEYLEYKSSVEAPRNGENSYQLHLNTESGLFGDVTHLEGDRSRYSIDIHHRRIDPSPFRRNQTIKSFTTPIDQSQLHLSRFTLPNRGLKDEKMSLCHQKPSIVPKLQLQYTRGVTSHSSSPNEFPSMLSHYWIDLGKRHTVCTVWIACRFNKKFGRSWVTQVLTHMARVDNFAPLLYNFHQCFAIICEVGK